MQVKVQAQTTLLIPLGTISEEQHVCKKQVHKAKHAHPQSAPSDDQLRIPPTLRGYYLHWKSKSRKVPGTKGGVELSRAQQWK